ncbi:MAG: hypothetical protein KGJ12_02615 [Gammaproteobacteria bacterium]|nr:hypothetical protein [Gammaproteobacteria bacterium]
MFEALHHPNDVQLDKLRAGLLDDEPSTLADVRAHVEHCAQCRARLDKWSRLTAVLELDRANEAALATGSRNSVPSAQGTQRATGGHGVPKLAMALAAALVLTLGLRFMLDRHTIGYDQSQVVANDATKAPDLYSNIDFYLWMAQHNKTTGGSDTNNS